MNEPLNLPEVEALLGGVWHSAADAASTFRYTARQLLAALRETREKAILLGLELRRRNRIAHDDYTITLCNDAAATLAKVRDE